MLSSYRPTYSEYSDKNTLQRLSAWLYEPQQIVLWWGGLQLFVHDICPKKA